MKRILFILLALFLIPLASAVGSNTTEGFSGFLQDSSNGAYVSNANITLNISTSESCFSNVIYSETFVNNVSNGVFSLLAGNFNVPLNLEYGRDYWSCYRVDNGTTQEVFGADPFTSGKGIISGEDLNTTTNYTFGDITINGWTNSTYFNGTYYGDGRNLIISTTYNATSIATAEGTLDDGNLASVQSIDSNWYNVSEDAGVSPLLIYVNFTGVDKFGNILLRTRYDGGLGHEIEVSTWNYDNSAWENHGGITDQSTITELVIDVLDSSDHISGSLVQLKFDHVQNGVGTHDFRIDYIALQDGFTTVTSSVHDSLLERDDKDNHPWAFPTDGSREITGDVNLTGTSKRIYNADSPLNFLDLGTPTWNSTGNILLYTGLNNGVGFYDETGTRMQWFPNNGAVYLKNHIYYNDDVDKRIELGSADNIIKIFPSLAAGANGWEFSSTGSGENSPIFYPSSNNEAQIGSNGRRILEGWISRFMIDMNLFGSKIINASYIGIGLTNPLHPLHVNSSVVLFDNSIDGSTDVRIQTLTNSDRLLTFREGVTKQWEIRSDNYLNPLIEPLAFNSNTANNVLVLGQDGSVSINTSSQTNTHNIGGDVNATGIIYTNSSERVCTSENGLCNDSTKEFFVPIVYGNGVEGTTGDFYRWTLPAQSAASAFTNFYVPQDMTSVTSISVVVIVGGVGGGLQITPTVNLDFGALSETYNTHSTSVGGLAIPGLTAGDILEVAGDSTGMNAGDYVGVQIVEGGGATDSDFHVIGVRFEYT